MTKLKVCFFGVGSIAKRHMKNLKQISEKRNIGLQIDVFRHSINGKELEKEIQEILNDIYFSITELPEDYDVIFITNPTQFHMDTLKSVNSKAKHFFIEKPVTSIDTMGEMKCFDEKDGSIYYVACPLRYSSVIQYIKKNINPEEVISVRSISSSFLPDWRPGCDYRDTYSAHRAMGGGVSIDLIHEWDYLVYLFGTPQICHLLKGKKSNLEIDSDDYAIYIADYGNKIIELHLDYFGRKAIREIMLLTKDDTIVGDLVNNKITFLKEQKEIDFSEQRNDYQTREIEHFLNLITGEEKQDKSNIWHALEVLRLTQGSV